MKSLKDLIAPITAIVMALAAIGALTYQMRADLHQRRLESAQRGRETAQRDLEEIQNWQRTVVRNILAASQNPVGEKELYRSYLDEIQNEAYRRLIPQKQYSKQELGRVLFDLQRFGVVGYNAQAGYFLREDSSFFTGKFVEQVLLTEEQRKAESAINAKANRDARHQHQ
jgi:hypothetical protein